MSKLREPFPTSRTHTVLSHLPGPFLITPPICPHSPVPRTYFSFLGFRFCRDAGIVGARWTAMDHRPGRRDDLGPGGSSGARDLCIKAGSAISEADQAERSAPRLTVLVEHAGCGMGRRDCGEADGGIGGADGSLLHITPLLALGRVHADASMERK